MTPPAAPRPCEHCGKLPDDHYDGGLYCYVDREQDAFRYRPVSPDAAPPHTIAGRKQARETVNQAVRVVRAAEAAPPRATPEDADATFLLNYAAALRWSAEASRKRGSVFGPECVDVQAPIFERIAARLRAPLASSPSPTPRSEDALEWSDEYWQLDQAILDAADAHRPAWQIAKLTSIRDRWDALVAGAPSRESGALLEQVSDRVHQQWMEAKRAAGVTSRKLESGEELMVPYAELSEQAKELDRGTVRTVLGVLPSLTCAIAPDPTVRHIKAICARVLAGDGDKKSLAAAVRQIASVSTGALTEGHESESVRSTLERDAARMRAEVRKFLAMCDTEDGADEDDIDNLRAALSPSGEPATTPET